MSLFDYLADSPKIDFHIVCGKKSQFENSMYYESTKGGVHYLQNVFFKLAGKQFYIQSRVIQTLKSLNPDVVILRGVNPQIISMLYAFIWLKIFRSKVKIYWWGHGTTGNQGGFGVSLRKWFYKKADGVLLQGKKGFPILSKIGINESKLHVIGNNMNDSSLGYKITKVTEKKIIDSFNLIFVGRLVQEKRVDLLIDAVSILTKQGLSIQCEIIGDGPIRASLEEKARDLGLLYSVFFRGALFGDDVIPYFTRSHLTVIPDYSGLSIIHGLSFGLPFVTSDDIQYHGPEIEVLQSGINGSIYAKNNVQDLCSKIMDWHLKLKQDNSIANSCIDSIEEYTAEFVGENILKHIAI